MVKFRCLSCGQKISVDDNGIGVVIACPTCAEQLIVPPGTDPEFAGEENLPAPIPIPPEKTTKEALLPHLARMMKNRLVQGMLSQRREMLRTQDEATEQITAMEQRVALLQSKLQRRISYYEERIAALQADLQGKDLEIQKLQQRLYELARVMNPRPLGLPTSISNGDRVLKRPDGGVGRWEIGVRVGKLTNVVVQAK